MIVIADQSEATASLLARKLKSVGLDAVVVTSAALVPYWLSTGKVSGLILDPGLAGGGVDLLRTVRADPRCPALPVILLSASDGDADIAAAKTAGATRILIKGRVTPNQLVAEVQAVVKTPTCSGAEVGAGRGNEGGARSYALFVTAGSDDEAALTADIGAAPGLCCPHCGNQLMLRVHRDEKTLQRWFLGAFVCMACSARRAHGAATAAGSGNREAA